MFQVIADLIHIGRPMYVMPAVVVSVVGYIISTGNELNALQGICVGVGVLILGMACWSANEIADSSTDSLGGTKTAWAWYVSGGTGLLLNPENQRRKLAMIATVFQAIAGSILLFFLSRGAGCLGLVFLMCGITYSVRPIRFKSRGMAGPFVTALAYSFVAFLIGWMVVGSSFQTKPFVYVVCLFILSLGVESIPAVIDLDADILAGDQTVAVRYGVSWVRWFAAIALSAPSFGLLLLSLVGSIQLDVTSAVICGISLVACGICLSSSCLLATDLRQLSMVRLLSVCWFTVMAAFMPILL